MVRFILVIIFIINSFAISWGYKLHFIKKGETLWSIAKSYNISYYDLKRVNNGIDYEFIRYGSRVKIPGHYHVTKKGDTIWNIARRYKVSPKRLLVINNMSINTKLKIGMSILISKRGGAGINKKKISKEAKVTIRKVRQAKDKKIKVASYTLSLPIKGSVIKRFGQGNKLFHSGITIHSDDSNVKPVKGGRVVFAGVVRGYGSTVIIDHPNLTTVYSSKDIKLYVDKGDVVHRNTVVASRVDTKTDLKLFFQLWQNNKPVNPIKYFRRG